MPAVCLASFNAALQASAMVSILLLHVGRRSKLAVREGCFLVGFGAISLSGGGTIRSLNGISHSANAPTSGILSRSSSSNLSSISCGSMPGMNMR